jgi:hypothetical protein
MNPCVGFDERVELGFALAPAAPRSCRAFAALLSCPANPIKRSVREFRWLVVLRGLSHISAMERAGMSTLNEGQKVSYDVVSERGKLAAASLQAV